MYSISIFLKDFLKTFLESLIAILVITYLKPSITFSPQNAIKNALILTVIFTILDFFNSDLCDKAKGGLFYSVGNCFY